MLVRRLKFHSRLRWPDRNLKSNAVHQTPDLGPKSAFTTVRHLLPSVIADSQKVRPTGIAIEHCAGSFMRRLGRARLLIPPRQDVSDVRPQYGEHRRKETGMSNVPPLPPAVLRRDGRGSRSGDPSAESAVSRRPMAARPGLGPRAGDPGEGVFTRRSDSPSGRPSLSQGG